MLKSAAIRSAVSLCLTVMVLLPMPILAGPTSDNCSRQRQSAHVCSGCGRCPVDAGEKCGCCQSRTSDPAEARQADQESCGGSASTISAEERQETALQVCTCVLHNLPPVPPQRQRTGIQVVVKMTTGLTGGRLCCQPSSSSFTPRDGSFGHPFSSPRDSQRRLCVWRI
jgi:hypothetical protein